MKIQSNYQQKSNPNFGAIVFNKNAMQKIPDFINLINTNAEVVNRLTPNNEVIAIVDVIRKCVYLVRPEHFQGFKAFKEIMSLKYKAAIAERLGRPDLMPQNAESVRLPGTGNAIINALKKITQNN